MSAQYSFCVIFNIFEASESWLIKIIRHMQVKFLLLTVFIALSELIFSQTVTIKGKVTSDEDFLGIPGVSVIIKGAVKGTITDIEGNYILPGVTPKDTLKFSFIGYKTREIAVGKQLEIDVILLVSTEELDEVVVTAFGVKRQQREIGYSTQRIEADAVVLSNTPNVLNGMTGRVAGVQVSQNDGVEGGSTRVVIRGNNTLGGKNQPLIVVDNVPLENIPGQENIGRGIDWGNPIADINPLDIETYNVLKGGAASALYGSRGANGVILITTKRGKKQEGLGVTFSYSYKWIHPYRFREMQNTYGAGGPISFTPPSFPMDGDTMVYPGVYGTCLLYTSPSPRDGLLPRMPSSA